MDDHVRGEIIQLLLTSPGERPFIPSFGGGLRRMVFEPIDQVTAGLTKAVLAQALQRWLSEHVEVLQLEVQADGAVLSVDLRYRVIATGAEKHMRFEHAQGS
ncbi:MAG: GPW/gp25 family protein [Burkholderiales bacterium]